MKYKKIVSSFIMIISLMAVSLYSLAQTTPQQTTPQNDAFLLATIKEATLKAKNEAKTAEADARAATEKVDPSSINEHFRGYTFGGSKFNDPPAITKNKQDAQAAMQAAMSDTGTIENYKTALEAYRKIKQQYKAIENQVTIYVGLIRTVDAKIKENHQQNGALMKEYFCVPCKYMMRVPNLRKNTETEIWLSYGWGASGNWSHNYPDPDSISKLTALFNKVISEHQTVIDAGKQFRREYDACEKQKFTTEVERKSYFDLVAKQGVSCN